MDEHYSYFLNEQGFGPAIAGRKVTPEYAEKYRGKLPDQLLTYWLEHGWCGYGQGLFWTVDPEDYEDVLDAWLDDTPLVEGDAYYVIARSAFGRLYLWGQRTGNSINIISVDSMIFPDDSDLTSFMRDGKADAAIKAFFSLVDKDEVDYLDEKGKPLFARAYKKLGPLAFDEMYAFEPALPSSTVKSVSH